MGVSILSDGAGKPFSVRPAADDDLIWNDKFRMFCVPFVAWVVTNPGLKFVIMSWKAQTATNYNSFDKIFLVAPIQTCCLYDTGLINSW